MKTSSVPHLRHLWPLVLIVLLLVPAAVDAQTKTLYWERYNVDITVQENGDLLIEEIQSIVFTSGTFTFGYRTIPLWRTDGITDIQVWEGDRQYVQSTSQDPFTFSVSRDSGELIVRWYFPPTTNSARDFVFRYRVQGGVRVDAAEGDSVFWKAIPPDHAFPINNARVTIRFPALPDLGNMVSNFTEADITVEENTVTFVARRPIPAGQQMEVGVAFGPGLVTASPPSWQTSQQRAETANLLFGVIGVLVLVGGLVGIFLLWYLRGRDPQVGLATDYLTEPPSDIPPAVAGTLVDERADTQDVIASIIDLARRGYLEMEETKKGGLLGLGGGSEFTFRRTQKPWTDLWPFEKTILKRVFGKRQERSLNDLRNKFYTSIPEIERDLYQQTVSQGFFAKSPAAVRGTYAGVGILLIILAIGGAVVGLALTPEPSGAIICPFISLGVTGIALIITGQVMPAKTRRGAEETAKWKAFRRYLREIERYTNLEEATDQFDRYLPYAIAFGLERSWINKFAKVPTTPVPYWYHPIWLGHPRGSSATPSGSAPAGGIGGGLAPTGGAAGRSTPSLDSMSRGMATGLSGMSAGLTSMLNTAGSTLVSRPQSSGSSGGSSGGWSGGGFSSGGGGGGGRAGFG
jgi:uncharacterized membrane protein